MRKPLIAGNWKMFKTLPEAMELADRLAELTAGINDREIIVAPPFTALSVVCERLSGSPVSVGAQTLHHEVQGAFTGEISGEMIRSAGASYVLIGHSERRTLFHETDEMVNLKVAAAFRAGLRPVLCIGETEDEKNENRTLSVLDKQIQNGLKDFRSAEALDGLVLAYEPVWAIGTGKTATADEVEKTHQYVRSLISDQFGSRFSNEIRILYGGSVKPENISGMMACENIDGALVGGASLDAADFINIITFD